LVFPYRKLAADDVQYAIFSRADYVCWQGIAGGGEDGETPLEAAKRESSAEAAITEACRFMQLDTVNSIPVIHFRDSHLWGDQTYVIPEYSFGVDVGQSDIGLSAAHKEFRWVRFDEAIRLLAYEGNRTALWELNQKLLGKGPRD
jgi:dATP pyrophosphohydrolase